MTPYGPNINPNMYNGLNTPGINGNNINGFDCYNNPATVAAANFYAMQQGFYGLPMGQNPNNPHNNSYMNNPNYAPNSNGMMPQGMVNPMMNTGPVYLGLQQNGLLMPNQFQLNSPLQPNNLNGNNANGLPFMMNGLQNNGYGINPSPFFMNTQTTQQTINSEYNE
jgi:hypothetical protein